MDAYPLDKQTDGCNSPHDWVMSLAMDSTVCVISGSEIAPMDVIGLVLVKT